MHFKTSVMDDKAIIKIDDSSQDSVDIKLDSAISSQLTNKPSSSTSSLLQQVLTNTQPDRGVVSSTSQLTIPTSSSSLIKSLLANKVTSNDSVTTASVNLSTTCGVTSNANNMHQVTIH